MRFDLDMIFIDSEPSLFDNSLLVDFEKCLGQEISKIKTNHYSNNESSSNFYFQQLDNTTEKTSEDTPSQHNKKSTKIIPVQQSLDKRNEFIKMTSMSLFSDLMKLANANFIKFNNEFIHSWINQETYPSIDFIQITFPIYLFEDKNNQLFRFIKQHFQLEIRTDNWSSFIKRLNMIGFKLTQKDSVSKIYVKYL